MKQVHFIDIVKKDIRPLHQEGLDEAENPNSRKLIKIEAYFSFMQKKSGYRTLWCPKVGRI